MQASTCTHGSEQNQLSSAAPNPSELTKPLSKVLTHQDKTSNQHKSVAPGPSGAQPWHHVRMCAQPCLTLCDPVDSSPPGFSVHGLLWAGRLEQGVISYSRGSSDNPRTKLRLLPRQVDSLPSSHRGSPTVNLYESIMLSFRKSFSLSRARFLKTRILLCSLPLIVVTNYCELGSFTRHTPLPLQ